MNRVLTVIGIMLLLTTSAPGQEVAVEIPGVERKPYSVNGFVEFRPVAIWVDTDAALIQLRQAARETPDSHTTQVNGRFQLDAGYRRGWLSAKNRTVLDGEYTSGAWTGEATPYEAYLSLSPLPSLTMEMGKKTFSWGKGYLWNPAAFIDRVKSPDDPARALEGFVAVSADYIRTFAGPLQVVSLTPVLLPAFRDLNRGFGEQGHVNVAARLYLLLYDTDVDAMFLAGGSRPARFGFDFSRNVRSNLEVHGEWTRVPDGLASFLAPDDTLAPRKLAATSLVMGLRYLTKHNTTSVVDYFHNGAGYAPSDMDAYFDVIERGYALTTEGDDRLLALARQAAETGYGRMNPMRHYLYGRVNQPDALGILYFALGGSAIVNLDDGSYSLLPEAQYTPVENLQVRWLANIQRGGSRTEFGQKQAVLRLEVRVRYYF
jgi:hypothetical protein